MRRLAPAGLALLAADPALAHAFDTGADGFSQFIEGAGVPLSDPAIFLALLPLGITLGIWRVDGVARIWPAFLFGLVAGVMVAPLAGISIAFAAILTGLAVSVMGVAALRWPFWLMAAVSTVVPVVAVMTSLEGHAPGTLPLPVYLGVLVGATLAVFVPSGVVAFTREAVDRAWVTIGWRVAASWIGAITMMLAALRFA